MKKSWECKKTHSKTIMSLLLERTPHCWKFGTKMTASAAILKTQAHADEGKRKQDGGCARLCWRHAAVPSPQNCGRLASCCAPKMIMMAASSFLLLVAFLFYREFCVQNSDDGSLLRVKKITTLKISVTSLVVEWSFFSCSLFLVVKSAELDKITVG